MESNGHKNGNGDKKRRLTRPKRRYSDQEKAAALAFLDYCKGNLTEAAEGLKIPIKTLQEWRDGRVSDDVANIRREKGDSIAALLEDIVILGLKYKLERPQLLSPVDLAIFADKLLIFSGRANQITENRNDTPDERKARLLHLTDKAKVA